MYLVQVFSSFINMLLDSFPVLIVATFRGAPGKFVGVGVRPSVAKKSQFVLKERQFWEHDGMNATKAIVMTE